MNVTADVKDVKKETVQHVHAKAVLAPIATVKKLP